MSSEAEKIIRKDVNLLMPRKELENHIIQFLKNHNMCVLSTCMNNIPRASPMEYYSKGTTLYLMPTEGQKMENIRDNPIVSVGVFAPYIGWLSVKGVQISGEASIITREEARAFKDGLEVYRWQKSGKEIGLKEIPETFKLLKIEAHAIEMLDISLKDEGYAPRQLWTA